MNPVDPNATPFTRDEWLEERVKRASVLNVPRIDATICALFEAGETLRDRTDIAVAVADDSAKRNEALASELAAAKAREAQLQSDLQGQAAQLLRLEAALSARTEELAKLQDEHKDTRAVHWALRTAIKDLDPNHPVMALSTTELLKHRPQRGKK